GALPPQVERPVLAPVSSIMGEILFFAISSDTDDPLTLRTIADTTVRRRLLAVPGVSQVTPIGGSERQFQVIAHPDALRANNVTLTELLSSSRRASQNTSAGVYTEGSQEYVLEAVGRARTPEEIGETVVALRGDRSVLVRNVADVRGGAAFQRGEGSRSGKPAVIVGVQKQPGANTIEVTRRLDRELDTLQSELPAGMTIDRRIFRQADFIEVAVANVFRALRDGGILVVIIVIVFLANTRASAITLTAIPLSLAAAVLALRAFGGSINTMTLGGMAIAVGDLVDDAIVDVENVVRGLGENRSKPEADGPQAPGPDSILHRFRDGHHRGGLPSIIRADWCRGPAVDAVGVRVHRGAIGVARGGSRCHAGAVRRLPASSSIDSARARRLVDAPAQGVVRARPAPDARSAIHRHRRVGGPPDGVSGGSYQSRNGLPAGFPRGEPDRAGEHLAGHVSGQIQRDRPAGRGDSSLSA